MTDQEMIDTIERAMAGLMASTAARKIYDAIKEKIASYTQLDELALATLKEVRQHCQSTVSLIDRILGSV